ncbi:MAG: hypothetical protein FJW31_26540 [Acidobacteria bacterium]|nr:hypothetical protein [Acidobacteriota bacterium]
MNSTPPPNNSTPSAKQEMEFRLSLLRLMTVPHDADIGPSASPSAGTTQQIEALAVLANRPA